MYKKNYIEESIQALEDASKIYVRLNSSMQWAESQNNLGIAYSNRKQNSLEDNLQKAIMAFAGATQVYHLLGNKHKYLEAKFNLGIAYEKSNLLLAAYQSFDETIEAAILNRDLEFYYFDNGQVLPEIYGRNIPTKTQGSQNSQDTQSRENLILNVVNDVVGFVQGEILSEQEYKQKLHEINNQLYQSMVRVCIKVEKYAEALEYAERSKVRILREMQAIKELNSSGQNLETLSEELQRIKKQIEEESKRLAESPDPNYDKINQLRQDFISKYPYKSLKVDQFKELAAPKTAIIEWYILGDSFCAFLIANDPPQPPLISEEQESSESPLKMGENQLEVTQLSHSEPDLNSEPPLLRGAGGIGFWQSSPQDLEKLIDWGNEYLDNYDSNRQQWQNSLETKLANLAQILHINEIVKNIPETCDQLILIPHRYLHLFPLHALPVSRENWQRFHPNNQNYCPLNPCLVDCFDNGVSYAPSCQLLHQVQKDKRGKFERFFAIQDPKNNLKAAKMEVQSIKNIFATPEIFAKQDAKKGEKSESKLEIAEKVADSHHLFFSCHGSFDRNDPLQSGLELADGTLTLEEIIGYFNLSQCSLVTLSACETGRVQLDNTDEYISLTSGFLLAGSPSLYVSLWSVSPLSTAILLIRTYENLYDQPGKFALALSQAQIWMRDTDIQGFLDWTNQCHLLDTEWRGTLQCYLEKDKATQGVCAKIYQNPFHWAGFCAAGKGEQNMTNSSNQIEIFHQLIQSDLSFNWRYTLAALKAELTDNDDNNVEIIENWLEDKPEIKFEYNANVMRLEEFKLPNKGQSPTQPGQQSQILKNTLENMTIAPDKAPEANQDTRSSP
ncbi:CHAT domain-containing protein [Microcoleus sp. LAD1_D5]|uniref:CHAT domain-containing protein n=1 Tax=unclassified Microcoleus TaxID=2642155 RepID=UPI002FCFC774